MGTINTIQKSDKKNNERVHTLFLQLDAYTKGSQLETLTESGIDIILSGVTYAKQTQKNLRGKPNKSFEEIEDNLFWLKNLMKEQNISVVARE